MDDVLLELFIRGAAGGVSKTQLLRSFKDEHGCSEEDLDFLGMGFDTTEFSGGSF